MCFWKDWVSKWGRICNFQIEPIPIVILGLDNSDFVYVCKVGSPFSRVVKRMGGGSVLVNCQPKTILIVILGLENSDI